MAITIKIGKAIFDPVRTWFHTETNHLTIPSINSCKLFILNNLTLDRLWLLRCSIYWANPSVVLFVDQGGVWLPRKSVSKQVIGDGTARESAIIEFGTPGAVLFASDLPLDFGDRLRLENSDGSLDTEAEIVAMQFHQGKTAVAARFLGRVANWIIKA